MIGITCVENRCRTDNDVLINREAQGLPPVRPDGAADLAEYLGVDDGDTEPPPPGSAA